MEFNGNIKKVSFDPSLQPLFDAMMAEKTIFSITFMKGLMNKDYPENDITLTDVNAEYYWQGGSCYTDKETGKEKWGDLVDTDQRSFYMSWVKSFIL